MTFEEEQLLEAAVVRLRARILALVIGLVGGVGIFVATASLLIRGGKNVGQHLRLLSNYCPGFTVTWPGAFIGLGYGLLYGAIVGYAVAWIYNRVAGHGAAPASR
ncbi:MAG: hypothetical protein AAF628_05735 [Planctomycetota bacterium]